MSCGAGRTGHIALLALRQSLLGFSFEGSGTNSRTRTRNVDSLAHGACLKIRTRKQAPKSCKINAAGTHKNCEYVRARDRTK